MKMNIIIIIVRIIVVVMQKFVDGLKLNSVGALFIMQNHCFS